MFRAISILLSIMAVTIFTPPLMLYKVCLSLLPWQLLASFHFLTFAIPTRLRWYPLFPWWLIKVSVFSCILQSFICHLWKKLLGFFFHVIIHLFLVIELFQFLPHLVTPYWMYNFQVLSLISYVAFSSCWLSPLLYIKFFLKMGLTVAHVDSELLDSKDAPVSPPPSE